MKKSFKIIAVISLITVAVLTMFYFLGCLTSDGYIGVNDDDEDDDCDFLDDDDEY